MTGDSNPGGQGRSRRASRVDTSPWWQGEDIAAYDLVDLAATLGALQLIPENADRILRLEAASAIVASTPALSGQTRISPASLRRWLCDSEMARSMAVAEDPFPNLFTEQISIPSGSFVVLPGLEEGIVFAVRHLLEVIASDPADEASAALCRRAREIAVAVLIMSNEVAERAGLPRHLEPKSAPAQGIKVPPQSVLTRIKAAVVFQVAEVAELLERQGLAPCALEPLTLKLGSASWHGEPWANPLVTRPFLLCGDVLVVVAPTALLSALLQSALRLAEEDGLLRPLALAFRRAIYATAEASLAFLGSELLQPPIFEPEGFPACEGFFSLDDDKVIHLLLVSDDLQGWSPETVAAWDVKQLMDYLPRRCRAVTQEVMRLSPRVRTVVHLVVVQGLGRYFVVGLRRQPEDGSLTLFLVAELLEIISLLEHSDPLAILKYARALAALPQETRVLALGPLAEYELYLSHQRSFYLSDRGLPNLLVLEDDLAVHLRARIAHTHDPHGAWLPSEGRLIEVLRLNSGSDHPLFIEKPPCVSRLRILVELESVAIWLLSPEGSLRSPYSRHYILFAQAMAYWLWQLEPSVKAVLARLGQKVNPLEFELEIVPDEGWFSRTLRSGDDEGIHWTVGEQGRAALRLDSSATRYFFAADNVGDRILVAHLVRLLYACCERFANCPPMTSRETSVESIVETHAPLGYKRMLMILETSSEFILSAAGAPPYRLVQDTNQEALLDELGRFLQSQVPWESGRMIPSAERVAFLRDHVVPFLFGRLKELVASLRPEGLLERLVARHEALLHEQSQHRLSLPTRIACYGGEKDFADRIRKELHEHREAAIASRFVIEFVVAQPPRGTEVLSLETYDRLLALSSAIFTWGTRSDYLHYNLVDLQLAMLPSGRIGVSRDDLETAHQSFEDDYWLHEVSTRRRGFARHWREREDPRGEKPPEVRELDQCTEAEFGLSLSDLVGFLSAVVAFGWKRQGVVKVASADELFDETASDLGWDRRRVDFAFDFFALKPRANFLAVSELFRKEDLYPWRFNRRLSYVRKPLLCRGDGGNLEVIWGPGQVEEAVENLVNLCLGGRLKAESTEMRRLISKKRQVETEFFNDAVADAFEEAGAIVRRRVKKIGSHRIGGDGSLGDIDVLVVAPATRRMLAVETKDLHVGRTPAEQEHELRNTFDPQTRSAAVRHSERIEWLRAHLKETLEWLDLSDRGRGRWKVEGLIVVNVPLLSPYLRRSPVPVLPWVRLKDEMPRLLRRGN